MEEPHVNQAPVDEPADDDAPTDAIVNPAPTADDGAPDDAAAEPAEDGDGE